MTKFRLASVLRARRAQEDAAKAAAVRARAEADAAAVRARRREAALDGSGMPGRTSAVAFSAAMWARQALAAELAVAQAAARTADETVEESLADLTAAAVRRRTLEKLEERHAATRRHAADTAAQTAIDDLTTAVHHRRTQSPEDTP